MTYDNNNIFAKVLRQEIPCNKVYEDDFVLAFHDIAPQAKVHVLVIPKGKFINFKDFVDNAGPDFITGFYQGVSKIIDQLSIAESGFKLVSNTGKDGGQEVPHYHIHILAGQKLRKDQNA